MCLELGEAVFQTSSILHVLRSIFRQTHGIGVMHSGGSTLLLWVQWIPAVKESLLSYKPWGLFGVLSALRTTISPQQLRDLGSWFWGFYIYHCAFSIASFHGAVLHCQTVTVRFLSLNCHTKQLYKSRNTQVFLAVLMLKNNTSINTKPAKPYDAVCLT